MRLLVKSRKKYHWSIIENYRSIIKDNTKHAKSQFKNQKNIAQNKSDVWALVARIMGIDCPAQGLPMPTWWAVDARVTGWLFLISVDTFLLYKLER